MPTRPYPHLHLDRSGIADGGKYDGRLMEWVIGLSPEFDAWFGELTDDEQEAVVAAVDLLKEHGYNLPSPLVTRVKGARRRHLRELHPVRAPELRMRFTFDPERATITLLAGSWERPTSD
jgi:hypothetical protein